MFNFIHSFLGRIALAFTILIGTHVVTTAPPIATTSPVVIEHTMSSVATTTIPKITVFQKTSISSQNPPVDNSILIQQEVQRQLNIKAAADAQSKADSDKAATDLYSNQQAQLQAQQTDQANQESAALSAYLKKVDDQAAAVKAASDTRENSSACLQAKSNLSSIQSQINALGNDYSNSAILSQMADLSVKEAPALDAEAEACEGFVPTPTPTTFCDVIGNTIRCQ